MEKLPWCLPSPHPFATGHKRRGPRVRVGSWSIFDTISILRCIAAAVSHLPVKSHFVQNLTQPKATFENRCLLVFGWHAVCPTHRTNIRVSAVFIVYYCTMQRTKHVTEMHALKRIMSIMSTRIWWNLAPPTKHIFFKKNFTSLGMYPSDPQTTCL